MTTDIMTPSYLKLYNNKTLAKRAESAYKLLRSCVICPRKCHVNRLKNEKGICKTGKNPIVSSYLMHQGEEPPISGSSGSGTIFFTNCNLKCVYCQNYKLSQAGEGREVEIPELADYMLELQKIGAHNINFVTPTHNMPQILKALLIAIEQGLNIPLVYNTSGYELAPILKILDGIMDIYLTDMRYSDKETSKKYSDADDYPIYNQTAVREMYKQVGNAKINNRGVIKKGLIIRHLVLPNNIAGTDKILEFIKNKLSSKCYISLMSQYFPCHKAKKYPELNRRVSLEEYRHTVKTMRKLGLDNGWIQESGGLARFAGLNIKPNV